METPLKFGSVEVARIGLGTNRLSHTSENIAFIRAAVAAGIGMIDTAHLYTDGESEETLGAALPHPHENVIVATKGGYGGRGCGRPEVLRREIDTSFERLRTRHIELYYLHRVDPETPIEESVAAIKAYVDDGRIGHVGVSEVTVEQLERARSVAPIAAVQNHYNLSERKHEAVVDHCTEHGIAFVPYYPLHGLDRPQLGEIAERHGATTSQIALAWLLRRSPMMLPIPGTLSLEHARENLGALEIDLADAEFAALD
jgi:aryl-alcohol dehydrogenase-like predicted oxidoreductase